MPRSANQKLKILYIRDFLRRNTDENHPASTDDIIEYLAGLNIPAERKTVYDDIDELRLYGEDIILSRGKNGGYFCGSSEFEIGEIKALVDSVQSSKFITEKESLTLIKKLEGLTNIYEAGDLHRQVVVHNRIKSSKESVFRNVDYISTAVNSDRKITFRYFNFNLHKKPEYRHNGKRYELSPFSLIWDNENYYLLGYDSEAGKMKHFRVDKMDGIVIKDEKREGKKEFSETDLSTYNIKLFGMFAGEEKTVTIRFRNDLVGVVIDRFGKNIIIVTDGDDHFTIRTKVQESSQFFAWLFGFGTDCEILEPESTRREMIKRINEMKKLYR